MPNQHANPQLNVRPPAEDLDPAKRILSGRGREISGFVIACLRALRADPDGFLGVLERHWPPPTTKGSRRRRSTDPATDNAGPQGQDA
jgi:hypothetical protein